MNPTLLTYSGRTIDMLHPKPEDIDLADIARGLSMQTRFAGHIHARFYSVAEHSVLVRGLLVEAGASRRVQRLGLLHDAAEAYLGDVIGPVKAAMRILQNGQSAYDSLEHRWLDAIGRRFDLDEALAGLPLAVKNADRLALIVEDRDLRAIPVPADAPDHVRFAPTLDQLIHGHAADRFLVSCEELGIR